MDKKIIVYQAYGLPEVIGQTQFSILSLLKKVSDPSAVEILIYTDQENELSTFFKDCSAVKIIPITQEQLKKWRGPLNFVHRAKIEILIDAGQKNAGSLFYCDGDTKFESCPLDILSQVNDRISLMHTAEGTLQDTEDKLTKKIFKFTQKHHFHIGTDDAVAIGASTEMWNAGFIGISEKNKSFLPLILQLTDQTYSLYQKHVMEQLAFSYILQINTEVRAIDECLHHYWDQKSVYQKSLEKFFSKHKNFEDCLNNFDHFLTPPLLATRKKQKKTFWRFFRR